MKKILKFALIPLILANLISCETPIPTQDVVGEEIAINSILIAGDTEQHLLMTALVRNLGDELQYLQEGQVEVNGVRFKSIPPERSDPRQPYNWMTSELKIQSGQLCSLRVFYKQRIIRGQTIIPAPLESVTIKASTIEWRGDSSHVRYALSLNNFYLTGLAEPKFYYRTDYLHFPPGRYRLRILAFDKNFEQALITDALAIGLEGAYGLFASACAWEDSVDLK